MDTPTPDIPLLRKVLAWAEEQNARPVIDSEWVQSMWRTPKPLATVGGLPVRRSCGTAYCIAGYTTDVILGLTPQGSGWVAAEHGSETVQEAAERALGLTADEGHGLFAATNDIHAIRRAAETIAARVGERL